MTSAEEILAALELHTNVLLYGPPGTGKSHLMKQVENLFLQKYNAEGGQQYVIDTEA
jgi:DNA replication protein DnaC